MELIRISPIRNRFGLRCRKPVMFDDFFYPLLRDVGEISRLSWNPEVDIYDGDDTIVIKAELPGIDKKDIHVDVKDGVLILKGERSSDNEVKEDKYYRRERMFGKFERAFTLPADVNLDKIKADYTDGVLKIDIPKPEQSKSRQITVH